MVKAGEERGAFWFSAPFGAGPPLCGARRPVLSLLAPLLRRILRLTRRPPTVSAARLRSKARMKGAPRSRVTAR